MSASQILRSQLALHLQQRQAAESKGLATALAATPDQAALGRAVLKFLDLEGRLAPSTGGTIRLELVQRLHGKPLPKATLSTLREE